MWDREYTGCVEVRLEGTHMGQKTCIEILVLFSWKLFVICLKDAKWKENPTVSFKPKQTGLGHVQGNPLTVPSLV